MSRSLSIASIIEKNRLASDTPYLVALDIGVIDPNTGSTVETLYVVNNTENITWNGNTYSAAAFDIEMKSESGQLVEVQLSIKDYTRLVQQRMQQYGGGVGFNVTVSIINSGNLAQGAEVQEFFEVTGAESNEYVCSFTLGAENAVAKTFPRRRQSRDYCQWRYKSADCGYTGTAPSCDLTLNGANGCKAHNNSIRFGGFPGINERDVTYG